MPIYEAAEKILQWNLQAPCPLLRIVCLCTLLLGKKIGN